MEIQDEKIYKSSEVAELFGVTAATVNRWIKDGKLKAFKNSPLGDNRITASEVKRLGTAKYGGTDATQ